MNYPAKVTLRIIVERIELWSPHPAPKEPQNALKSREKAYPRARFAHEKRETVILTRSIVRMT